MGPHCSCCQHRMLLAVWLALLVLHGHMLAAAQSSSKLSDQLLKKYLSNDELVAWMDEFIHKCSHMSRKYSIGKSARGAELWVLEISDKPGVQEAEPHFKYVGNMHGNEPSGRMLLPQLAEWLCANYNSTDTARRVVDHMHTHLLVTMNPDGFAARKRANGNHVDLNRNFPDPVELHSSEQMEQPLPNAEPETIAMMKWTLDTPFVASANLHEGAIVANYPFDGYPDHSQKLTGQRHPAPDDKAFQFFAKLYAKKHAFMAASKEFPDGITNGAQWYPVYGGMQDWNYVAAKCMAITLELSEAKWRPEGHLQALWEENREALVALPLAASLGGISGTVVSAADGSPLPATVMLDGIAWNTSARLPTGYFNRPAAPGVYTVRVVHPGYQPASAAVTVPEDGSGVVSDFTLVNSMAAAAAEGAAPASRERVASC
ncbi:hypothetical protein COO60DRAFT_1286678 [Scenedesmus sp. NREL 46B-D3]|nr:hypothetical protein COO60DRAFT_1286678 [Scenedesmus sp. NREL 46B-D3]